MVKLLINELSKLILIGDWHTEDIDSEHLSFSVFLTGTLSKNSCINDPYIVFISRWKKVADKKPKEYEQSCKQLLYLNELLQIMWCVYKTEKWKGY